MSKFSEFEHKLADFLAEEAAKVRGIIGAPIVDGALDKAADEIEVVQAVVSRALHAFLDSKGLAGKAAASLVDGLLHTIAGTLEGAAKAAESK